MKREPNEAAKTGKPRGRPLSFDRETALGQAMHVFWLRGYDSASISELTAAMGITAPSMYTAFGGKEQLYLAALERYANGPAAGLPLALAQEPTAYAAIHRLLQEAAEEHTRDDQPKGCMIALAGINVTQASVQIQGALARRRDAAVKGIRCRIEYGIKNAELPEDTDAGRLANFYATVYRGMSLQAADGASQEALLDVAVTAMRAWPGALPADLSPPSA